VTVKNRQIRIVKMSEQEEAADLRKTTTPQERLEITWQLSQNAWAFKAEPIAEPGLNRQIVRVGRMKDLKP
jgi:hypothetical protein